MSTGVFKEHVASVASISRYDADGAENTGASYRTQLHQSQNVEYDFAVDTGAIGTFNLELPYAIPSGSIVYASLAVASTTVTSGGAATIALGVDASSDLTATPISLAQMNAGFYEPRVGAVAPVITTAERSVVQISIATAAITAGVVTVNIQYLLPNDA